MPSLAYTAHAAGRDCDRSDVDRQPTSTAPIDASARLSSITGNFHAGQDVLGFTNQNGITGSFNATTGILTLGGTASVAAYQAALESVDLLQREQRAVRRSTSCTISYQVKRWVVSTTTLSNVATAWTVTITPVNNRADVQRRRRSRSTS